MKSVVFDLDGTLADTSADLIAAANAVFEAKGEGRPLDPIADRLTAFRGGRAMLKLGYEKLGQPVDADLLNAGYQPLLDAYAQGLDDNTFFFDGVEECLVKLAARGYALGICTNKPFYLAEALIARLGMSHHFGVILGADSLDVRKPDPEHLFETIKRLGAVPAQSALIGDTITDAETARAADVTSILVTFGADADGVSDLFHHALLDDFAALPDLVDRLLFPSVPVSSA